MNEENFAKKFINVHFFILEEYFEYAYAFLNGYPFTGIEEKLDEIIVTFPSSEWNDELRTELLDTFKGFFPDTKIIKEETIQDRNWNEEWEKNVPAIDISPRIAITPEWRQDEIAKEIKILINPKMSFGTGQHATTRLMCRLMEKLVKPDSFWIDAGTGTGVLAILAIKLGAKGVFAFDNNIWSIENTLENVELNKVESVIKVSQENIETVALPHSDGIAANLYSHLLIPSMPMMFQSLSESKGDLIVSGILKYYLDDVVNAAIATGFTHIETLAEEEWVAIHFKF